LNDIRDEVKEQEKDNSILSAGYMMVGNMLRRLPIGSFFDIETGIFYWQPGPGFLGEYKFVFLTGTGNGRLARKHITVKIVPR
ncbi:MAG: hypothetical protein GTO45_05400, partial [Candidatus Aminicenantes bacterium]|nr:hypothetical protein [Candidatus Aminicenantes bacterium]NIM78184.1 hypothetical protein [Candidatus Aminicenantes bacterium]NIN17521.1 hypothetical protein [Candidatus Aminicenantes bacterium]NIN41407.1 hypothetical protein [Candidatus Aminicenantes bacterium]NIN84173.1 hypothetical protein [Candidatus Aminicenantes bacterium]